MISHVKRLMQFNAIIDIKIIIVVYVILMNINSPMALAKFEMTLGEGDVCWPAGAEIFCEHADLPLLQCLTVVNAKEIVDACTRSKAIINKSVIDECLIIMRHRSDGLLNSLQEFGLNAVNECRNYFDDPILILGCTRVMTCTDSENFR